MCRLPAYLSTILLLSLLASCGKNPQSADYGDPQAEPMVVSPDMADDLLQRGANRIASMRGSKTDTASGQPMGVGIAQYVGYTEKTQRDGQHRLYFSGSNCTASYLGGDVILAAHCVPKVVREGDQSCRNLVFRTAQNSQSIYRCSQIVWYSAKFTAPDTVTQTDSNQVSPDVLIFRLEKNPPGITGLRLASHPFDTAKTLTAVMYTPVKSDDPQKSSMTMAYLGDKTCNKKDKAPDGHSFRILSCTSVHGNSGSPALNEQGEIQIIIAKSYKVLKGAAAGVDVSCIQPVGNSYRWNPNCIEYGKEYL